MADLLSAARLHGLYVVRRGAHIPAAELLEARLPYHRRQEIDAVLRHRRAVEGTDQPAADSARRRSELGDED
jgi:hypothetical protein